MSKAVTICMTSFNRFNLLKQTVNSLLKLNTYPIEKFIIIEDSAKPEMKNKILQEFGKSIELIYNDINISQVKSIDKMYNMVTTDYIFHTEEDYTYTGNANFIRDSVDILEERKDIHQVWVRYLEDFTRSHGSVYAKDLCEPQILRTVNNSEYKIIKSPYYAWCGFSWNPGLRRTEDYHKMFPNGYSEFIIPGYEKSGVHSEAKCNEHAMKLGYRAAFLLNSACKNIGINQGSYLQ